MKPETKLEDTLENIRRVLKAREAIVLTPLSVELQPFGAFSEDSFEIHQSFAEGLLHVRSTPYVTATGKTTYTFTKASKRPASGATSAERLRQPVDSPGHGLIETSKAAPYGPLKNQGSILYFSSSNCHMLSVG
jgi:hypothetical protein